MLRGLEWVACADVRADVAASKAQRYGLQALDVDALLRRPDIDIVLNLTVPAAHRQISLAAIAAGKHVYSEKPLAVNVAEGREILRAAAKAGVRVGVAPDTILGAATQTTRRLIDSGALGKILFGWSTVLSHGTEHWHPAPDFLYKAGGGPVFDFGPYSLATLVTLLGPVATVTAVGQIGNEKREISAPNSPRRGEFIPVEVLTTLQGLLGFAAGPQVSFIISWDAWNGTAVPLELHGTEGSLQLPDPNWFGGDILLTRRDQPRQTLSTQDSPSGRSNYRLHSGATAANYRGLGLAEMAQAIEAGRPHRVDGQMGLHLLAVMESLLDAAQDPRIITIADSCARPAALSDGEAAVLLGATR